jgi:hypothetical protein
MVKRARFEGKWWSRVQTRRIWSRGEPASEQHVLGGSGRAERRKKTLGELLASGWPLPREVENIRQPSQVIYICITWAKI